MEQPAAAQRTLNKTRELTKAEREADSFFTCGAAGWRNRFYSKRVEDVESSFQMGTELRSRGSGPRPKPNTFRLSYKPPEWESPVLREIAREVERHLRPNQTLAYQARARN